MKSFLRHECGPKVGGPKCVQVKKKSSLYTLYMFSRNDLYFIIYIGKFELFVEFRPDEFADAWTPFFWGLLCLIQVFPTVRNNTLIGTWGKCNQMIFLLHSKNN